MSNQIKDIPDSAFTRTIGQFATYGFDPLPGCVNLMSNPAYPGLLFRRVANVGQALIFGGVWLNASANWSPEDRTYEIISAAPNKADVGDLCTTIGRALTLVTEGPARLTFESGLTYYNVEHSRSAICSSTYETNHVVNAALAVVTPNSVLGFKLFGGARVVSSDISVPAGIFDSYNNGSGYRSGAILQSYLLQWRELPFVADVNAFISSIIPALGDQLPEGVREDAVVMMRKLIAEPGLVPKRHASFVLQSLSVNEGAPIWGGTITANSAGEGVFGNFYNFNVYDGPPILATDPGTDHNIAVLMVEGPLVGRTSDGRPVLIECSTLTVESGVPAEAFSKLLQVAPNYTLDMEKLMRDFAPVTPVSLADGVKRYEELFPGVPPEVIAPVTLENAISRKPAPLRLRSPLGASDVHVDVDNFLARTISVMLSEKLYSDAMGTVYAGDESQAVAVDLVAPAGAIVYTKDVAVLRGADVGSMTAEQWRLSGPGANAVLFTSSSQFVIPQTGMYSLMVVAQGSDYQPVMFPGAGVASPASSAHGTVAVRQMLLRQGLVLTLSFDHHEANAVRDLPYEIVRIAGDGVFMLGGNSDLSVERGSYEGLNPAPDHMILQAPGVQYGQKATVGNGPRGRSLIAIQLMAATRPVSV